MRHFFGSLLLSFFLLSFLATPVVSQEVEQLHRALDQAATDTARARLLYELTNAYREVDSKKFFEYGQQALKTYQQVQDPFMVGRTYYMLGLGYNDLGDYKNIKECFLRAKEQFGRLLAQDSTQQHLKWWVKSSFAYGASLGNLGMRDQQISAFMDIEPYARKIRETETLALIHTNLGITFHNIEQYEKAYEYFKKSDLAELRAIGKGVFIQDRLIFASCLHYLDSLATMKLVLDQVRDSLVSAPGTKEWSMYHILKGEYYFSIEDFEAALKQYDQAHQLLLDGNMPHYLKEVYIDYAGVYLQYGDYSQAEHYLQQARQESRKYADHTNELLALKSLADLEQRKNNYQQAAWYLSQHIALTDSLDRLTLQIRINQLETAHQTKQKEREILTLERQNYLAGLALEKEQFQSYLNRIVFGSALVLLILGSYIFFRRKQHETEKLAQERKMQVQQLQHQQQTNVLSALIEGQEKERQRLASDLHDGLAGRLSGITFKLAKFTQQTTGKPTMHDAQELLSHMNNALAELRCIARNLTPKTLSEDGLKVALEDYCSSLRDASSNIILQFYDTEEQLEEQISLTLYRVVQELIHNAVKYAQASEILVQYIRNGPSIDITVEDDGIGFDVAPSSSGSRMGLTNVRTRVDYLQGKMEIQSSPDQGTTVWIQLSV